MNEPIRFSGEDYVDQLGSQLSQRVLAVQRPPVIAAIFFREDAGSRLYTKLKSEAAERVGIAYQAEGFSLADPANAVLRQIQTWVADPSVTGIIVQKPWSKTWLAAQVTPFSSDSAAKQAYNGRWDQLMAAIPPNKDVDGLSVATRSALAVGRPVRVVPATCRAVLHILLHSLVQLPQGTQVAKIALLGKSDLLTIPLYNRLLRYPEWWIDQVPGVMEKAAQIQWQPQLFTSRSLSEYLAEKKNLFEFDVVVSATGVPNLVSGEWIKPGTILIDAGEPKGDISQTAQKKSSFFTPVPGGVGPLTVDFLLMNCVDLAESR